MGGKPAGLWNGQNGKDNEEPRTLLGFLKCMAVSGDEKPGWQGSFLQRTNKFSSNFCFPKLAGLVLT